MSKLEDIIANGNRGGHVENTESTITCADGFNVSVIAGGGTYCTPRPAFCSFSVLGSSHCDSSPWPGMYSKGCDYTGPFTAVEVGYPSAKPEPWDQWSEHFENWGDTDPTKGVYGYVSVDLVRELIATHGGERA